MDRWIEYPVEPKELILAWQAPSHVVDRTRWAVGHLWKHNEVVVFDYFKSEELVKWNLNRSSKELFQAGYAGYPAFDVRKRPEGGWRHNVIEAFLRRLPHRGREDYSAYLAHFRIRPNDVISPLGLLAITEARLPSDGFSLVDPLDPDLQCVDVLIEIAGVRHLSPDPGALAAGNLLTLREDTENQYDAHAVKVNFCETTIGYVNRLQARTIRAWLRTRLVKCWITRVNGKPESPRVHALMRVRPLDSVCT